MLGCIVCGRWNYVMRFPSFGENKRNRLKFIKLEVSCHKKNRYGNLVLKRTAQDCRGYTCLSLFLTPDACFGVIIGTFYLHQFPCLQLLEHEPCD